MRVPPSVWFVVLGVLQRKGGSSRQQPCFTSRALTTPNEIEFFGRLRDALPEHYVFPQIAMSALLDPVGQGKAGYADFLRIAQKRIDYGIFTSDFQIVAVAELDDRSYNRVKDQRRDGFVTLAGIRTVRFQASRRPGREEIREVVLPSTGTVDFFGQG